MARDEPGGRKRPFDSPRRSDVGAVIRAGYEAMPQEDEEVGWPDGATAAMIEQEPW